VKHPRSVDGPGTGPDVIVTDLGEPGPGAELVAHLVPTLEHLADGETPTVPGPRRGAGRRARAVLPWRSELLDLFEAQAASRWLDVAARRMHAAGRGHHTVGSAGHEGDAAVALALRADDPALLHYRSGAFYLARSVVAKHGNGVLDMALGLAGARDEPIAGGRHKVLGHPDLAVIPQTSTVASHLPRAAGVAWTIGRQRWTRERRDRLRWPDDAVVVASFGDAAANHSTAAGAVNAACWAAARGVPMPLLLVCEDNGLGLSTPTPPQWIRNLYEHRPGLEYFYADTADDPCDLLEVAQEAAQLARQRRRPVLLHLACVRIGGHTGTDAESAYRSADEIAGDLERDPLLATMRSLVRSGVLSGETVVERFLDIRDQVASAVGEAMEHPPLTSATAVMQPLAPRRPAAVAMLAARHPPAGAREHHVATRPDDEGPLTLAESINRALLDAALVSPSLLLMGQDVARLGGLHGVTRGLLDRLGPARVVDTLFDEQTVLGLALGAGVTGLLPVPEIRSLASLHTASDQLRGEAATLSFFSQGAFRNPMVVRVPGLSHRSGFGGLVHDDNAIGSLRDIPGLLIACPAHPSEAPGLLRTCLASAEADGAVSVFLEPVALYDERDMLVEGDGAWTHRYAGPQEWGSLHAPVGRASVWGDGRDLTIASFGNGLRMSMRAAAGLARAGLNCRVVDLRWLAPLPVADVVREADVTGRLLIVDETRRTGGVSEGLITGVLEAGFAGQLARVTSRDSLVPLGPAAGHVLLSEADIAATARALCE
jgi:2-oxoisovalerate dehydrogenase E1 component